MCREGKRWLVLFFRGSEVGWFTLSASASERPAARVTRTRLWLCLRGRRGRLFGRPDRFPRFVDFSFSPPDFSAYSPVFGSFFGFSFDSLVGRLRSSGSYLLVFQPVSCNSLTASVFLSAYNAGFKFMLA